MKKSAFVFILFVLILAIIPFSLSFGKIHTENFENNDEISQVKEVFAETDKDLILSYAMSLAKDEFCDETLKALISVAKNNSELNSAEIIVDTYDSNSELYKKLESLLKESNTKITYNNEAVYIPLTELSSGFTSTSDEYPYIKSVASPWDCTSVDYVYDKDYNCGISLYGIDYLCKEGYSEKKALAYYLFGFTIK